MLQPVAQSKVWQENTRSERICYIFFVRIWKSMHHGGTPRRFFLLLKLSKCSPLLEYAERVLEICQKRNFPNVKKKKKIPKKSWSR